MLTKKKKQKKKRVNQKGLSCPSYVRMHAWTKGKEKDREIETVALRVMKLQRSLLKALCALRNLVHTHTHTQTKKKKAKERRNKESEKKKAEKKRVTQRRPSDYLLKMRSLGLQRRQPSPLKPSSCTLLYRKDALHSWGQFFLCFFFPLYSSVKVTDQKQLTHYTLASSAFLFFFFGGQLLCSIRNTETRVSVHREIKRGGPSASSILFFILCFCFVTAKHKQTVNKKKTSKSFVLLEL